MCYNITIERGYGMKNFSYSTFTKKQANVIYAAIKRGELTASKQTVREMYNLVGATSLDTDEQVRRGHFERCISHLLEGRTEFAQMELDGHTVRREYVVTGTIKRVATDDDWFEETGSIITEEIGEWCCVA